MSETYIPFTPQDSAILLIDHQQDPGVSTPNATAHHWASPGKSLLSTKDACGSGTIATPFRWASCGVMCGNEH